MTKEEIKGMLEKQLTRLADWSAGSSIDARELAALTSEMCEVAALLRIFDECEMVPGGIASLAEMAALERDRGIKSINQLRERFGLHPMKTPGADELTVSERVARGFKKMYLCDPHQNDTCSKSDCAIFGGRCCTTSKRDCSLTGRPITPMEALQVQSYRAMVLLAKRFPGAMEKSK